MSVSWQPSQNAAFPLGMRLPSSTSSSDYGGWYQNRAFPSPPPLAQPASAQRRNPTRKLGALAIPEVSDEGQRGDSTAPQDGMDQTGRVNSFLNKVQQEGRVPRSPRTPELLDLPGRIVRAPRTRHMTPRNSPDAARYAEIDDGPAGPYPMRQMGSEPSLSSTSNTLAPSPRVMERSKTMADLSPRVHGELTNASDINTTQALTQQNPFGLQRSNTMLPNQFSNQRPPLQPIPNQYVIPKYPFDRSQTMLNLNPSNAQFNVNNDISPRLQALHRSNSNLDLSKFSQPNTASVPFDPMGDNRVSWNFRRMPSFIGSLPAGQSGRRPMETFGQPPMEEPPKEPQVMSNPNLLSRYMFTNLPDSNAKKHSADAMETSDALGAGGKPRIPMYWLYGSRGLTGMMGREEATHSNITSSNPNTWGVPSNGGDQSQQEPIHIPTGQTIVPNESDFLGTSMDRRDAYRSNYSSYNDNRGTQSEPDKSEFKEKLEASAAALAAAGGDTASLPDDPKVRSILKKESAYAGVGGGRTGPTYSMRAGHGARLPHLAMSRRATGSKRVTFAM